MASKGRTANGRSSIYEGSDGRWHGWVSMGASSSGKVIRRHVSASTKAAVTRKVRRLEQERDAGDITTPGRKPTLDGFLKDWIKRRAALDVRPKTVAGYETDARYIAQSIGGVRLDLLRVSHFEQLWRSMVLAGRDASIPHTRRTLNACLNDAIEEGLLARNPLKGARTPRHEAPEIEPFSVEEVRRFLRAALDHRNAARWMIAVVLGLRQGEVLGLQWSDLDLPNATLTVRRQLQRQVWAHGCADRSICAKRGADCPYRRGGGLVTAEPKSRAGRRTIGLPMPIVAALSVHRQAQLAERLAAKHWVDGDWLFTTEIGAPIDQRRDWQEFKDLLKAAELRNIRLHDLRHSAATLMLEADTDLKTTGQILGHGSIGQTSKYTHILADRKRAAAARIETLLWGSDAASRL